MARLSGIGITATVGRHTRCRPGAIAHQLCRLIWKILHQRIRYEERGPAVSDEAKKVRARKMIRELRTLGYHVELLSAPLSSPA
jgi:hypothetical protein